MIKTKKQIDNTNLIFSIEVLIDTIKKTDFHGLYVDEVFKVEQELVKIREINLKNDIFEQTSKSQ